MKSRSHKGKIDKIVHTEFWNLHTEEAPWKSEDKWQIQENKRFGTPDRQKVIYLTLNK